MASLTEAAKAVLMNESNDPRPDRDAKSTNPNKKTLAPKSEFSEPDPKHNEAEDLGGPITTVGAPSDPGVVASSKAGKDSSRSGRGAVQGEPMKKFSQAMHEDEEVDGDLVEEEIEVTPELEAFVAEAIEAGLSEDEIQDAIAENFEFVSEEDSSVADYQIDMSEHVDALLAGEELSEEFKDKATTIFEAAVKAKLEEEVALLEQAYAETLEERVAEIQEQLSSDVDDYLNYVVEQWIEENEVAVESALRSELTEDFISGLRSLFAEHYIDIPEEEVSVVEELSQTVEELESKLNEEIERNVALTSALNESHKFEIVASVCEGLTTTQAEKLKGLVENVEYTSDEEFINKVSTLRENYFPTSVKSDEVLDRVETSSNPSMISEENLDGRMSLYTKALGRSLPK